MFPSLGSGSGSGFQVSGFFFGFFHFGFFFVLFFFGVIRVFFLGFFEVTISVTRLLS